MVGDGGWWSFSGQTPEEEALVKPRQAITVWKEWWVQLFGPWQWGHAVWFVSIQGTQEAETKPESFGDNGSVLLSHPVDGWGPHGLNLITVICGMFGPCESQF